VANIILKVLSFFFFFERENVLTYNIKDLWSNYSIIGNNGSKKLFCVSNFIKEDLKVLKGFCLD
jgi:hypothetical protein